MINFLLQNFIQTFEKKKTPAIDFFIFFSKRKSKSHFTLSKYLKEYWCENSSILKKSITCITLLLSFHSNSVNIYSNSFTLILTLEKKKLGNSRTPFLHFVFFLKIRKTFMDESIKCQKSMRNLVGIFSFSKSNFIFCLFQ